MTYKDAVEVLNKYYTGRKDKSDYPDFDDMHEALDLVNDLLNEHLYFEKTFEQDLAEKDKEIARLVKCLDLKGKSNSENFYVMDDKQFAETKNFIRHQVCEEIREKLLMLCDWYEDAIDGYWYATAKKINYVLDQIEKEKEKQNDETNSKTKA